MRPDLKRSRSGSDSDSVNTPHYHWNPLEPGSGHKRTEVATANSHRERHSPPHPIAQ
ncbi:hypothetical protein F511_08801 [Dorcoceras hygrometricum]|uniref:Uncharacterized protein n=1 Tax=Dorcoceras hygrometricum TaxID=472368 RepID=A0A2Z7ADL3_9LAMI|nr:hypothetical protein F511_08801 [Dorcoceras hygrometricum]